MAVCGGKWHSHFHKRPARCREINLNFTGFAKIYSEWIRGLGAAGHDILREGTAGHLRYLVTGGGSQMRPESWVHSALFRNLPISPETQPRRTRGKHLRPHSGQTVSLEPAVSSLAQQLPRPGPHERERRTRAATEAQHAAAEWGARDPTCAAGSPEGVAAVSAYVAV